MIKKAHQIHNIRIVKIQTELHATNSPAFKKAVYDMTGVRPQEYLHIKTKIEEYKRKVEESKKPSKLLKVIFNEFY